MTDEAWIDTVRLARDFGTVSELFSEESSDLRDIPWPLFEEIRDAMTFLNFEQLPDEEQPPRKIWHDRLALNEWFKDVKIAREEKFGNVGKDRIEGDTTTNPGAAELEHALRG